MRFFIVLVFFAASAFSGKAEIVIKSKASSFDTVLYSVDSVEVITKKIDHAQPLNSHIEFQISGVLEANSCGYDDFSIRKTILEQTENSDFELSKLTISPITNQIELIEVGNEVCTLPCNIQPFKANLRLGIFYWDGTSPDRKWSFSVEDESRKFAKIDISYNQFSGWDFQFKKLESRSCGDHP